LIRCEGPGFGSPEALTGSCLVVEVKAGADGFLRDRVELGLELDEPGLISSGRLADLGSRQLFRGKKLFDGGLLKELVKDEGQFFREEEEEDDQGDN